MRHHNCSHIIHLPRSARVFWMLCQRHPCFLNQGGLNYDSLHSHDRTCCILSRWIWRTDVLCQRSDSSRAEGQEGRERREGRRRQQEKGRKEGHGREVARCGSAASAAFPRYAFTLRTPEPTVRYTSSPPGIARTHCTQLHTDHFLAILNG